jgi:uncharacterized heparinase superfamily protein
MATRSTTSKGAWRTLLAAAGDEWRATPLYRLTLRGQDPDRIGQWGNDPRIGDAIRGAEILRGGWRIASERLPGIWPTPWAAPAPSPHFMARLHSFSWLGDLAAAPQSGQRIAELIQSWTVDFGAWHPQAWAPELTAQRLAAWLCHGRPAFEGGDAGDRPALMRSFAQQARHLMAASGDIRDPLSRIKAGLALTLVSCAGAPEADRFLDVGLELIEEACAAQFLPDGMHQSRAPEAAVETLADFLTIRDALTGRSLEPPRAMRDLIGKLAGILRYLQMGDGGVACFHGGGEGDPATIAKLLSMAAGDGRTFRIAPHSGYHRLHTGDTVLVFDAGAAPPPAYGDRAHAGCLAFEMTCGAERVIVNVGSGRELLPNWRAAGRATNGHSTLIVDDALSATFEAARKGRNAAARPTGPPGVSAKRTEDEDGAWIEAQHEGYRAEYGLIHRRTLYLSKSGTDLRGLEALARPLSAGKAAEQWRPPFAVRFHLHPSVVVERLDIGVVRLETPGGAHFRLRTDAAKMAVEDSIYLSARETPQRARQVVFYGEADPNGAGDLPPNRIRWALTRIDAVE